MKIQFLFSIILTLSSLVHAQAQTYTDKDHAIDQQLATTPNMYSPWRDEYVTTNIDQRDKTTSKPCPFCLMRDANEDEKYLVLYRSTHHMIVLNLNPYTRGHLLIVPYDHQPDLKDLSKESRTQMLELTILSTEIIKKMFHYEGFNIGFNIGAIAGASIPGHLHMQVVPRKAFEASFLYTIANTQMTHYDLQAEYQKLLPKFKKIDLMLNT